MSYDWPFMRFPVSIFGGFPWNVDYATRLQWMAKLAAKAMAELDVLDLLDVLDAA